MYKPKILLLPDIPGWAMDKKVDGIIKYASHKYDFTKMHIGQYQNINYDEWDLILLFPWFAYDQLPRPIKKEKMIAGISSHTSLKNTPNAKDILRDNFIAISPCSWLLENELRGEHPNIFYAANGVDTDIFVDRKIRKPGKNLVFGWVGKENRDVKNYYSVIEPAIKMVNDIEFRPILANKMQKNNEPVFTSEQMVDYYNNIDVIICASTNEGGPNTVLEGGACGCILLSTRVGFVFEFGVNNYIKIDNTIESFIAGIDRIKDMSAYEFRFLQENLQMTIRNMWSWKVRVENYIKMFDTLLGII